MSLIHYTEYILLGLLPYGDSVNDSRLNDGLADEITLHQPFPFFGQKQEVVYVSKIFSL